MPLLTVDDDGLATFGLRRGDRVALNRRGRPEYGDVVALHEPDGATRLWRAWPGSDGLRLSRDGERRDLPLDAPLEGVVVATWRRLVGECRNAR